MDQAHEKEQQRPTSPLWKKILIIVAAVLVLAGLGLKLNAWASRRGSPEPAALHGDPVPKGAQGFAASGATGSGSSAGNASPEAKPGLGEKASPFLLTGGVSFFVGLAVGAALRAFYKVALIVAGIGILGMAGLSYSGAIGPIDWKGIESWVNTRLEDAEKKTEGFRNYLLLSVPSAGMAGAGLVAGFKRK